MADYACALSGLVSVPIYATLNLPQTAFILQHSRARWVVCSTPEQLAKVLSLWPELPDLEAAVLMDGAPRPRTRTAACCAWDGPAGRGRAARRPGARRSGTGPGLAGPATC